MLESLYRKKFVGRIENKKIYEDNKIIGYQNNKKIIGMFANYQGTNTFKIYKCNFDFNN